MQINKNKIKQLLKIYTLLLNQHLFHEILLLYISLLLLSQMEHCTVWLIFERFLFYHIRLDLPLIYSLDRFLFVNLMVIVIFSICFVMLLPLHVLHLLDQLCVYLIDLQPTKNINNNYTSFGVRGGNSNELPSGSFVSVFLSL